MEEQEKIDVIIRTKDSSETIADCIRSVLNNVPVRRIIIMDNGSTDNTIQIASSFDKVEIYAEPQLTLGELTTLAFSRANTEWIMLVDSDMILRNGWFNVMQKHMSEADVLEGCEINHYKIEIPTKCSQLKYGRFGQILLKKDLLKNIDLKLEFGEDVAVSHMLIQRGTRWKKVTEHTADHYPKFNGKVYRRTGTQFSLTQTHVPKQIQIHEGHLARKYNMFTKRQLLERVLLIPVNDALRGFRRNFWFCLAYLNLA